MFKCLFKFEFIQFSLMILAGGVAAPVAQGGVAQTHGYSHYYYWVENGWLRQGRCSASGDVSLPTCQSQVKSWPFENVRQVIWVHLWRRYPYAARTVELKSSIQFLDEQVALFKKVEQTPPVEKKIAGLLTLRNQTETELALLAKPETAMEQFDGALMSDPKLVVTLGDHLYPLVERNEDLLLSAFSWISEDSAPESWCTHFEVWTLYSNEITHADISRICDARGERLPMLEDVKGRLTASIFALEERARYGASACPWITYSTLWRALPTMEEVGMKAFWLMENNEMYGQKIQAMWIGPNGSPCRTSGSVRFGPSQQAGGVCVRALPPEARGFPCGKWRR